MIVEVCLLLRMVLSERQQLALESVTVTPCGVSKEPVQDINPKSTLKPNLDYVPTPDTWDSNPNPSSLWVYRPSAHQSEKEENEYHNAFLKGPFLVTRLAKPLTFGFDPYFNKGYFAPFERRQKPVTLIAFRRNGLLSRRSVKVDDSKSAEVAEMQSPYNEISSFWQNEPGFVNE